MGKIEGIFATNISGKVGNVVFRKNGKQNIVSQRPASVKNPRTDMQQRQRAYIKTVSSAYSVLRPICDHSFEGVAYGADSMNFFKKENYKIVSSEGKAVLKNSSNVIVDSEFLISKGSIVWNKNFEGGQICDISEYLYENGVQDITELEIGQFLQALGIKNGDQLTVINLSHDGHVYTAPNGIKQIASNIYYSRYIIESGDSTKKAFVKRSVGDYYYILNASILAQESEIDANAVIVVDTNGVIFIVDSTDTLPNIYTAIISRRNGDKWLRSTATLNIYNAGNSVFDIEKVLPSYRPTGERYLNNAER